MDALELAKDGVEKNLEKGSECPCCGQYAKRYKRALNGTIAAQMIAVYVNSGREYVHVNTLLASIPRFHKSFGGGDFTKLSHWGLVERKIGNRDDGCKYMGFWRVTEKGEAFIKQEILVASHIYLYNRNFQGYSQESISILKALGKKFNYDELMAGI